MTSRRNKNQVNYADGEYGWEGSEDEYHSDGETAIKETKKAAKAEARKKAQALKSKYSQFMH